MGSRGKAVNTGGEEWQSVMSKGTGGGGIKGSGPTKNASGYLLNRNHRIVAPPLPSSYSRLLRGWSLSTAMGGRIRRR